MKVTIYGEEFDIDFLDADEMERAENACQNVLDKIKSENFDGMSQSQLIRAQCQIVFDFFDEVLGAGAHERIFKGKCNLPMALNAYDVFLTAKNNSVNELSAIRDKYSPSRAQRRTTQQNSNKAPIPYKHGHKKGYRTH